VVVYRIKKRGGRSTGHRAQGTGEEAQSAGHRAQGTGLAGLASRAGLASLLQ